MRYGYPTGRASRAARSRVSGFVLWHDSDIVRCGAMSAAGGSGHDYLILVRYLPRKKSI